MAIAKIVVADVVHGEGEAADALADLKAAAASEWLGARYPEAEICADVAIYKGRGPERPPELFAYDENEALDEALSRDLQGELAAHLADIVRERAKERP